ncbi:sushi, von Willebrand factor type A, EGF and pentraxin domain-containing protein 1-like isoform X2 [Bacillus rossius redtenbacheri]|uniref:sushi, von Willebrand factor type A, EGF and pentraxin domain-containing protein 1-like isoform X2 n=1 Tax=Bacillus rossius redtenbacheri TaxID=93214 RepID=UPI002FDC92B3
MTVKTLFILFGGIIIILSMIHYSSAKINRTKVSYNVDCPDFGSIENGKTSKIENSNIQSLHIDCLPGFYLIGRPKVLCNDGQWEQIPRPQCAKQCPPPPFVRNAVITMERHKDANDHYRKGSVATYSCGGDFVLTPASSSVRICKDGVWTGTQGTCVAYGCPAPPEIADGYYVLEHVFNPGQPDGSAGAVKAAVNQRAHYMCNLGYALETEASGSATLQCIESGDWSPRIPPQCSKILSDEDDARVSCGAPQLGPHTSATTLAGLRTSDGRALPGTELELNCREGHRDARDSCPPTAPPTVLRCVEGRWQGSAPRCVEVNGCVSPTNIPNGVLFGQSMDGRYQINEQVAYTCAPGYVLFGNPVLSCGSSGCWEPAMLPECRAEVFVSAGYISSSSLLVSLVTALGVMLVLLGVCLVVVCRRRQRPWHHRPGGAAAMPCQRSRPRPRPVVSSPSAAGAPSPSGTALHDPDRVALIACADGVLLGESVLPSYEEAVRERSGSSNPSLLACRAHRPHWAALGTGRRPRPAGDQVYITRQSSRIPGSHSRGLGARRINSRPHFRASVHPPSRECESCLKTSSTFSTPVYPCKQDTWLSPKRARCERGGGSRSRRTLRRCAAARRGTRWGRRTRWRPATSPPTSRSTRCRRTRAAAARRPRRAAPSAAASPPSTPAPCSTRRVCRCWRKTSWRTE